MKSVYKAYGNMATAELQFVAKASDNGVNYRCEAKNKAIQLPMKESVSFVVFCK